MIVFNLWGALFVVLAVSVGVMAAPLNGRGELEPITAGIAGIVVDLAFRAHRKSGPWKGTRFGNVAGDLFDPTLGGMVMIVPIWFWGVALSVFGILHYARVL